MLGVLILVRGEGITLSLSDTLKYVTFYHRTITPTSISYFPDRGYILNYFLSPFLSISRKFSIILNRDFDWETAWDKWMLKGREQQQKNSRHRKELWNNPTLHFTNSRLCWDVHITKGCHLLHNWVIYKISLTINIYIFAIPFQSKAKYRQKNVLMKQYKVIDIVATYQKLNVKQEL